MIRLFYYNALSGSNFFNFFSSYPYLWGFVYILFIINILIYFMLKQSLFFSIWQKVPWLVAFFILFIFLFTDVSLIFKLLIKRSFPSLFLVCIFLIVLVGYILYFYMWFFLLLLKWEKVHITSKKKFDSFVYNIVFSIKFDKKTVEKLLFIKKFLGF